MSTSRTSCSPLLSADYSSCGKIPLGCACSLLLLEVFPRLHQRRSQVDGEVMEALCSELDKVAGFVRGMSASHRQEVLDDIMIDSNWKKLVGMPKFLMAKLDRAQSGLTEMREALDGLSKSVGSKWVKEWEREEKEAFAEGGIGAQLYEAAEIKSKPPL